MYETFSPETKAMRFINGVTTAANHYFVSLNKKVHENTIRKFKTTYLLELKEKNYRTTETCLTPPKRGPPTCIILGELDPHLWNYIRDMPELGVIINTNIVRCIARWVLLHKNKFILEEFSGLVNLTKEWACSILN